MKFNVLLYNFSTHKVEHYDVIPYFIDSWNSWRFDRYKVKDKDDLKPWIKRASQYQFWARCQYECLIAPWPFGSKRIKDDMIEFLKKDIDLNNIDDDVKFYNIIMQDMCKIDIHEQIMMNIDVITDLLSKEFKLEYADK